jgi:hypothetical protein
MYVNGKIIPILGMGEGMIKGNDGEGEFKYDIFVML